MVGISYACDGLKFFSSCMLGAKNIREKLEEQLNKRAFDEDNDEYIFSFDDLEKAWKFINDFIWEQIRNGTDW